jgi:hypothetical protein
MSPKFHHPRVVWNGTDARVLRPELWLAALGLLGLLLGEVWQNARVAELCLRLERTHRALEAAQAREAYVRADLERRVTRAALSGVAHSLGLVPAEARQLVALPAEYLARDASRGTGPALALAERIARVLVPEATARERSGNEP